MKFIVTKPQLKLIFEISRQPGHLDWDPIDSLMLYINKKLPKKYKLKFFKKFFEKNFNTELEIDDFFEQDVLDFFDDPEQTDWVSKFKSKVTLSSFAYYIMKNYFGLDEGFGLNYFIKYGTEMNDDAEVYYFFDPQLKIFIGFISVVPVEKYGTNFYKVVLSAVDEELIGTGYGIKMYQNLLLKVDYLMSDDNLYSGSYRIWKHVLPKYANVWGIIEDEYEPRLKKLDPNRKTRTEKFDNFIASVKYDDL